MSGNDRQSTEPDSSAITFSDFQALIRNMYFDKDEARGVEGTFMWLTEEFGELASALRKFAQGENNRDNLGEEFADVIAWLTTIANVVGIDISSELAKKYGTGCPGCHCLVCCCDDAIKP
jgi:NTP pyrophosphatase (non-canonical NTP hydrolase)